MWAEQSELPRKGDVTISDGKEVVTLAQGQQTTRDDSSEDTDKDGKKKKKNREAGKAPAAGGGWLNSPIAVGTGLAAAVTAIVLTRTENPATPNKPN
jgi:hypothetical protein